MRRIENYLTYMTPCSESRVLELGCGMGWFTQRMKDRGFFITAMDIQTEFVQTARSRAFESRVSFLVGDAERLPFDAGSFDACYGTSVLHHVPLERVLDELFRVLKSGAKIIFSEPNMMNPQVALIKNVKWIGKRVGESPHETAYFRWELERCLRKTGFKEVSVRPFDFLHPATPTRWIPALDRVGLTLERLPLLREIAGSLEIKAKKP